MNELLEISPGCVFANLGFMGHPWVIVAKAPDGALLMANWSSLRPGKSAGCVLHPTDHPLIKHDSYMVYALMREISPEQLHQRVEEGNLHRAGRVSPETLKRIWDGFFADKKVPPYMKTRYSFLKG